MTHAPAEGTLHLARQLVHNAHAVVALTGAGVSTESGIPDFRGPDGLWTKNPAAERAATIDNYMNNPEARRHAWRNRVNGRSWDAQPHAGHHAFVTLERQGKLEALLTQNVDGLHIAAGNSPAKVIELHGTMREIVCMSCGDRGPASITLDRVRAGEEDPECLQCGGILKSGTISFGQALVTDDLARAEAAARHCDLLLAVGSSLVVYPAAGLVPLAAKHGAAIVIVNAEPTPYDGIADVIVRDPIGKALPVIVEPQGADR